MSLPCPAPKCLDKDLSSRKTGLSEPLPHLALGSGYAGLGYPPSPAAWGSSKRTARSTSSSERTAAPRRGRNVRPAGYSSGPPQSAFARRPGISYPRLDEIVRFFVDEKLTEYMKEPKNQLREYHGKEPEEIGPWGRFRTREWIEDCRSFRRQESATSTLVRFIRRCVPGRRCPPRLAPEG